LGSTTARVLNETSCPVLTMQHAEMATPRSAEHRRWVCALGLSPDSERVLHYAKGASSAAGAEHSVIHTIHAGEVGSETATPCEEERARQRIAELRAEQVQTQPCASPRAPSKRPCSTRCGSRLPMFW